MTTPTKRISREYCYRNSDGQGGMISVSFGPWGSAMDSLVGREPAPIMISFEDGAWMGIEQAEDFLRWFRMALAEAKRRHVSL